MYFRKRGSGEAPARLRAPPIGEAPGKAPARLRRGSGEAPARLRQGSGEAPGKLIMARLRRGSGHAPYMPHFFLFFMIPLTCLNHPRATSEPPPSHHDANPPSHPRATSEPTPSHPERKPRSHPRATSELGRFLTFPYQYRSQVATESRNIFAR